MYIHTSAVIVAACLALTACGGGSDSGYDATAFPGTWNIDVATCDAGFNYNPALYAKNNSLTITVSSVVVKSTLYTDAACTAKAGVISETYNLALSEGKVSGWSNVAKVDLSWANAWSTGADGGTGVSLTSVPDGSFSLPMRKTLLAAKGSSLYAGDPNGTLDSASYPTAIEPGPALSR